MKKFIKNTLYSRAGKEFLNTAHAEIDAENMQMLRTGGLCSAILMALVMILTLNIPAMAGLQLVYLAATCAAAAVFAVAVWVVPRHIVLARPLYYLWAVCVNAFAVYLGTVKSVDTAASAYFMIVIITASLVLDRPIVPLALSTVTTICFVCTSAVVKAQLPDIVQTDMVNAMFAWLVSVFYVYFIINTRLTSMKSALLFQERSETDRLTGLSNKATAEYLCKVYLQSPRMQHCALLVVDVDDFKKVNDTWGHAQGDLVLQRVGTVLRDLFRESDVVGRFGGDEFVVLMKNISSAESVREKQEQLLERVRQIDAGGNTKLNCSVGAVLAGPEDTEFATLFAHADDALYQAKHSGKNSSCLYSESGENRPIMVVADDSDVSRALLVGTFAAEYEVLQAADGEHTMRLLRDGKRHIAVLLLDIEMPTMNGYEVLKEIRTDDRLKDLPVLVITADERNELRSLEYGADDIVVKPFEPRVVQMRVKNVLERCNNATRA